MVVPGAQEFMPATSDLADLAAAAQACRPWLIAELTTVQPDVLVLLGATAAKSLMGNDFRLTAHRREALRGPHEDRETAIGELVADLRFAIELLS